MKKFIVLYYAPKDLMEKTKDTPPEERKKSMEKWHAWAKKCGSGLLDLGAPLGNAQVVTSSGSTPSNKNVIGYSMLQADSMEDVKEMLKGHPHIGWDAACEIEVNECIPIPK